MPKLWRQLGIATNWPVLVAVAVLSATGVITIWGRDADLGKKQLMFLGLGLVVMALLQATSYQRLGRWAWPFYGLSMALLIYTVAPGVPRSGFGSVPDHHGSHAWIDLGMLQMEPAELMKLAFCMVLARYLRFRSNYRRFDGLLAPFALALVPLILILKQPALGMALLFIPALYAMLFTAGARKRHLLTVVVLGIAIMPAAWLLGHNDETFGHVPLFLKPYQWGRVKAMLTHDPQRDYQTRQALAAMGSGGWFGKGFGNMPAGSHVPEAHNDMIFALIGEQFGFFGSAVVIGAYLALMAAGLEIAAGTKEPFGRLVAVGVVAMLASQTLLNLAVCTRMMPVTGITLPFVSYGGSSLLASFMSAGILLNIGQSRPIVLHEDGFGATSER